MCTHKVDDDDLGCYRALARLRHCELNRQQWNQPPDTGPHFCEKLNSCVGGVRPQADSSRKGCRQALRVRKKARFVRKARLASYGRTAAADTDGMTLIYRTASRAGDGADGLSNPWRAKHPNKLGGSRTACDGIQNAAKLSHEPTRRYWRHRSCLVL